VVNGWRITLALAALPTIASGSGGLRPLSTGDTIEARQILYPFWFYSHESPIQYSPDRRRYLLITTRGDLGRDGNVVEFFGGTTHSLKHASAGKTIAHWFSGAKSANALRFQLVRWFRNGRSIAFLWKYEAAPRQVLALDLETGAASQLTHSATDVVTFDISENGEALVYAADPKSSDRSSEALLRRGFAVSGQEIYQFINGRIAGPEPYTDPKFHVQFMGEPAKEITVGSRRTLSPPVISVSPNGNFALVTAPPTVIPKEWNQYDLKSAYLVGLEEVRRAPAAATDISQFWVVDTRRAMVQPLFDAPRTRPPTAPVAWLSDGVHAVIGPTFLPALTASEAGLKGDAIAQVNIQTGELHELEMRSSADLHSTVTVELRQHINSPPVLYASDEKSGRSSKIFELNPELRNIVLGKVEIFRWTDDDDRSWTGTLYSPTGRNSKWAPAPLVVQLSGAPAGQQSFSLLGLDIPTAYAAQLLANKGMAVLNVYRPDEGFDDVQLTPQEPRIIQAGVAAAIGRLVAQGLVDEKRVGLLGFSRAGWYVLHILTNSTFEYAAANVCDNIDASYLQFTLGTTAYQNEMERNIGAAPFGGGLQTWLRESPGFRADSIRMPLRLERDQGGEWGAAVVLHSWEMFSRMRQLQRPVELYVVPQIGEGEHQLEGPLQQLASRDGAVDWFDFWLTGHEDPNVGKAAQYERWRKLRTLQ
jgi:dipeptidyl aminopeptidase/acylaminoacyl peptidase